MQLGENVPLFFTSPAACASGFGMECDALLKYPWIVSGFTTTGKAFKSKIGGAVHVRESQGAGHGMVSLSCATTETSGIRPYRKGAWYVRDDELGIFFGAKHSR